MGRYVWGEVCLGRCVCVGESGVGGGVWERGVCRGERRVGGRGVYRGEACVVGGGVCVCVGMRVCGGEVCMCVEEACVCGGESYVSGRGV